MKTLFIACVTSFLVVALPGKKPLIEKYDEVVEAAMQQLNKSMEGPEGELFLFQQSSGIKGLYDFDITLHEKGEVATVFVRRNEGGSISFQNKLKDFLKEMEFDFKMPKGKDYKFNYTFNFN